MKYKAVYDVLNERRQTTPGFCYHDRSGWRAYSQTYMTMQCPLWIIAEDAATGRRLWITQEMNQNQRYRQKSGRFTMSTEVWMDTKHDGLSGTPRISLQPNNHS